MDFLRRKAVVDHVDVALALVRDARIRHGADDQGVICA